MQQELTVHARLKDELFQADRSEYIISLLDAKYINEVPKFYNYNLIKWNLLAQSGPEENRKKFRPAFSLVTSNGPAFAFYIKIVNFFRYVLLVFNWIGIK